MKENNIPESIRIKYCRKGDRHFRLYNCSKKDFNYDKLISLSEENQSDCLINMYICSSIKEEISIKSQQEFEEFISSDTFSFYFDSKYNCLKLQFMKTNKSLNENLNIKEDKLNELINDKTSLLALDFILTKLKNNEKAKKDLKNFLITKKMIESDLSEEINDTFFNNLFQYIFENYENFIRLKSSDGNLDLSLTLENYKSGTSQNSDIKFSSIYNLSELNKMTNHEIINSTSIFRSSNIIRNETTEINNILKK